MPPVVFILLPPTGWVQIAAIELIEASADPVMDGCQVTLTCGRQVYCRDSIEDVLARIVAGPHVSQAQAQAMADAIKLAEKMEAS